MWDAVFSYLIVSTRGKKLIAGLHAVAAGSILCSNELSQKAIIKTQI